MLCRQQSPLFMSGECCLSIIGHGDVCLFQMYISDYNQHSTEHDFRKALDLLGFVDKVCFNVFCIHCNVGFVLYTHWVLSSGSQCKDCSIQEVWPTWSICGCIREKPKVLYAHTVILLAEYPHACPLALGLWLTFQSPSSGTTWPAFSPGHIFHLLVCIAPRLLFLALEFNRKSNLQRIAGKVLLHVCRWHV